MRTVKTFLVISILLIFAGSCNIGDLDQPPLGKLEESKIANRKGVERLLIGAYSLLDGISRNGESNDIYTYGTGPSNWIYGSICGTEAHKGSHDLDHPEIISIERFKAEPTNNYLAIKWSALYAGVARANTVLRVMKKATDIPEEEQIRIAAEARFLRAFYHFEAAKLWNKVPFVDETITYEAGNYYVSNEWPVWEAIENDFRFAAENLPETQAQVGRANSYAAKAFLAKVYLFEHKFAAAKPFLQDLIDNGKTSGGETYGLIHYADNFNIEKKNSAEHVFSVQMSVNDGAEVTTVDGLIGGLNGNLSDEVNLPTGPGSVTQCCGFFQPSQYLVNRFKTDAVTGLPDLENFNNDDVKNDQNLSSNSPFIPDTRTLDPRLDWTVGRRGIPYLDWGDHPGQAWIRNQPTYGPYSPKKNVYYKSQAGKYTNTTGWSPMASASNVNLIRFADVLLWAAEVEVETGDLEKARNYVNRVRSRAADPSGWIKRADGSLAANYKIGEYTTPWTDKEFARKAVRYERALELAMEGHRFFDLVRWGIADIEINTYLEKEKEKRTYLRNTVFRKNCNEYFPIPQTQIDLSAGADGVRKMIQNPCYL